MEPTYKIYAKGFRVGPLALKELKIRLADTPAPAGATVALTSAIGDQFGPIEHFPELAPYIASAIPPIPPQHADFIGPRCYEPNHIPLKERFWACGMILVGTVMLWFYLKTGETEVWASKRGSNIKAVGWWGLPAAAFALGVVTAGSAMISDHYDRRPNEHIYQRLMIAAMLLMFAGKFSMIIVYHQLKGH